MAYHWWRSFKLPLTKTFFNQTKWGNAQMCSFVWQYKDAVLIDRNCRLLGIFERYLTELTLTKCITQPCQWKLKCWGKGIYHIVLYWDCECECFKRTTKNWQFCCLCIFIFFNSGICEMWIVWVCLSSQDCFVQGLNSIKKQNKSEYFSCVCVTCVWHHVMLTLYVCMHVFVKLNEKLSRKGDLKFVL